MSEQTKVDDVNIVTSWMPDETAAAVYELARLAKRTVSPAQKPELDAVMLKVWNDQVWVFIMAGDFSILDEAAQKQMGEMASVAGVKIARAVTVEEGLALEQRLVIEAGSIIQGHIRKQKENEND